MDASAEVAISLENVCGVIESSLKAAGAWYNLAEPSLFGDPCKHCSYRQSLMRVFWNRPWQEESLIKLS